MFVQEMIFSSRLKIFDSAVSRAQRSYADYELKRARNSHGNFALEYMAYNSNQRYCYRAFDLV